MTLQQTYRLRLVHTEQRGLIKPLACRKTRTIIRVKATKTQRRKRAKMLRRRQSGSGSEPTLQVLTGETLLKVRQAGVMVRSPCRLLCVQCTQNFLWFCPFLILFNLNLAFLSAELLWDSKTEHRVSKKVYSSHSLADLVTNRQYINKLNECMHWIEIF